jgi:glutaconyl-CoA/methylmalonyl-CoA decarboxylase subunit gamma
MKEFDFTINGNDYSVKLVSFSESGVGSEIAKIKVNGTEYEVLIKNKVSKTPIIRTKPYVQSTIERTAYTSKEGDIGANVKSPIPGVVLKILKKKGDTVKMGDTLLILEAMKMQNEIQASKDGVIKEIKVKVDENVLEGDVLVVIE